MSKILTLFLLFVNLFSLKVLAQAPNWFLGESEESGFIYGTASSRSKEDAINMALLNASAKIRTEVGGVIKTQSKLVQDKAIDEVSSAIIMRLEKISISDYKIENLEYDKKQQLYYVQIKINKSKLFNERLIEYDAKKETVLSANKKLKGLNLKEKIENAKIILKETESMKREIYILYSLNNAFLFDNEYSLIKDLSNYSKATLSAIKFKIIGSDKNIVSVLKAAIVNAHLKIEQNIDRNTMLVSFTINQAVKDTVYEKFISKTVIKLDFKDASGNLIKSELLNFNGSSGLSKDDAYMESLKDLENKFTNLVKNL